MVEEHTAEEHHKQAVGAPSLIPRKLSFVLQYVLNFGPPARQALYHRAIFHPLFYFGRQGLTKLPRLALNL